MRSVILSTIIAVSSLLAACGSNPPADQGQVVYNNYPQGAVLASRPGNYYGGDTNNLTLVYNQAPKSVAVQQQQQNVYGPNVAFARPMHPPHPYWHDHDGPRYNPNQAWSGPRPMQQAPMAQPVQVNVTNNNVVNQQVMQQQRYTAQAQPQVQRQQYVAPAPQPQQSYNRPQQQQAQRVSYQPRQQQAAQLKLH
jgi:hypothetical protein